MSFKVRLEIRQLYLKYYVNFWTNLSSYLCLVCKPKNDELHSKNDTDENMSISSNKILVYADTHKCMLKSIFRIEEND